MGHLLSRIRLGLLAWDESPWKGLLLRLGLGLLVLFPWGAHLERVSMAAQDLDPVLLEACRAEGLDILNPALWTHPSEAWRRWALVAGSALLAWWLLSRLLRLLQRRWGLGVALVALPISCAALLLGGLRLASHTLPASWILESDSLVVWGGWLHGARLLEPSRGLLLLGGLILVLEVLLAAWRAHHLLTEARSQALRAALTPHFLYNALNTLQGLVEEDPAGARKGLARLGTLLRRLLERKDQGSVSLGEELAFVEDYLGLERARLGDRLQVVMDIPEDVLDVQVPTLGLQVLVENAVKHAIAPRAEGGTLHLRARREGRDLVVSVLDPGNGLGAGQGLGLALANLRSRLARPGDLTLQVVPGGHEAAFRLRRV